MKTEMSTVGRGERLSHEAAHALERLIELRAGVGDSLNDAEFTQLVAPELVLHEEGFSFVCFCDGWVTLRTPKQDPGRWYGGKKWLAADKEGVADRIAKRFNLAVCEPPDRMSYMAPPAGVHHHLEFVNDCEAVAIAHPLYLKIRLVSTACGGLVWKPKEALPGTVEFFRELVELYE